MQQSWERHTISWKLSATRLQAQPDHEDQID
jgi:hypothetical protein